MKVMIYSVWLSGRAPTFYLIKYTSNPQNWIKPNPDQKVDRRKNIGFAFSTGPITAICPIKK